MFGVARAGRLPIETSIGPMFFTRILIQSLAIDVFRVPAHYLFSSLFRWYFLYFMTFRLQKQDGNARLPRKYVIFKLAH